MAKPTTRYVCQECGAVTSKWAGKCEICNAWKSIVEQLPRFVPIWPTSSTMDGPKGHLQMALWRPVRGIVSGVASSPRDSAQAKLRLTIQDGYPMS